MRQRTIRGLAALALLVAAEAIAMLALGAAVTPAAAQLFDDRFPFQNPFGNPFRRQQQQQQQQQQYWNPFQPQPEQRPAPPPADYSRAPAPKKPETTPTTNLLVFGDSFADWLAYGLEVSFTESPEMGVIRKHRTWSGLIRQDVRRDPRGEHPDWPKAIQEMLATETPDFIVMMVGLNDRRPIREPRAARAAVTRPGQPGAQPKPEEGEDTPPAGTSPDTQGQTTGGGSHEFRSERWSELYIKRIDETLAALKSKGVPVFWVGLPPVRGTRSTADFSYLNDLFRSRAERAGVVYVDVWDGFVDEGGRFATQGPDVEGQIRRLRTADGVHFTQAGARKLAHYVERELQRWMTARAVPVALPVDEPPKGVDPAKPATEPAAGPAGTARPLAGPVITLGTIPIPTEGDEQLAGGPRQTKSAALDVIAAKVIVKGEAMPAPAGRADDFAWPRREPAPVGTDPVVAFTTLPMTPMKAERQMVAEAPAAAPTAAPGPSRPAAPTPRVARVQPQVQQQQPQLFGWFGQPYRPPQYQQQYQQQQQQYRQQYRQAPQRPTFFPFLFGGGR